MTDTPYFVIDDLTIGYHKVPVIRDISVKVQKGEIIALIGPNGAGKSTLLKTIARDLEPIRGKIFLEGRDMQTITYRELSDLPRRCGHRPVPVHRTARRAPRRGPAHRGRSDGDRPRA